MWEAVLAGPSTAMPCSAEGQPSIAGMLLWCFSALCSWLGWMVWPQNIVSKYVRANMYANRAKKKYAKLAIRKVIKNIHAA